MTRPRHAAHDGIRGGEQKRVLLFTSFPPPVTGQNVMAAQVADWVDEVAVAERLDTADPDALTDGGHAGHLARMVTRWRSLRRALRDQPDVLYLVLSSSTPGRLRDLVTVALARRHVGRIVGHVQVGDWAASLARPGLRRASRWLLRRVDVVLMLSASLAENVEALARPGTVWVVPNTAPAITASPAERVAKRAARATASTLRVAFVANMMPGKGFGVMLEGVARYQSRAPQRSVELDVVGTWRSVAQRAAFVGRVRDLGLDDCVRVHGTITDRAWMCRLYLAADVVALPSQYRHEALPVCLVEALATATPVIGTDHAALPDLVTPATGVPLADTSPETIADALQAMTDPERWCQWSHGAEALYDATFAPDRVRPTLLAALGLP